MTIDHRQLALDHAEVAEESTSLFVMQKETRLAQIHATLAVAEQARIANLLKSLSRVMPDEVIPDDGLPFSSGQTVDQEKRDARIASTLTAIREGLGI